jgi:hypothetical protein
MNITMEDYLKNLNEALKNKLGSMVGAITELEMGLQARDQELRRLYETYEPERLKAPEPAPDDLPKATEEPVA